VWLVVGAAAAHGTTIYSVTDLGDLPGGEDLSGASTKRFLGNWD